MIGLQEAGQAVIGLLSLPYLYIGILLVWWHARQGVTLQRRLFHVRMYGSLQLTLWRTGAGLLAGAALSVLSLSAGAAWNAETLLTVWIGMLVLSFFRLRYICLAYAAGVIGILQAVLTVTGTNAADGWGDPLPEIAGVLQAVDVPGLLFLAGLLHIAEGLLARAQGAKTATPLFLEGKRGKPVGAYALSGLWPVPLLWLVPASGTGGFTLPWTPLFGIGGEAAAWTFMAFPVLIGFSDRTESYWPEVKARSTSNSLIVYGVILAALAAGAYFWSPLTAVASAAAFLLHEAVVWFNRSRETGRNPVYAQDGTGVKILAVLPGTPAAEMGLLSGETIRKVNGLVTRSKEDLHAALQKQSAFTKIEAVNREGHVRFVQRARFEGEHHQLGLILAPDEKADYVAGPRSASLWQSLKHAGARRRRAAAFAGQETSAADQELAAGEEEELPAFDEPEEDPGLPPRGSKSFK